MVRFSLFAFAPAVRAIQFGSLSFGINGDLHGFVFQGGTSFEDCDNSLFGLNDDGSLKWRSESGDWCLGERMGASYQDGEDGTIYVKARGKHAIYDSQFYAFDDSDGSVKWQKPYHYLEYRYSASSAQLKVAKDAVYVECGAYIDAIDKTGTVKGTWQLDSPQQTFEFGPGGSVVIRFGTKLTVLSQDLGKVEWIFENPGLHAWASSKDGIFAVLTGIAAEKMDLIYLRGDDGAVTWNVSLPVSQDMPAPRDPVSTGSNGEVYVNGVEKDGVCSLLAFDVGGNILRSMPCLQVEVTSGSVMTLHNEDGTLEDIFVHALGNNVIAYSGTTGGLLWNASFSVENEGYGGLAVKLGQDGTVFAFPDTLYREGLRTVIAIRNGVEAWRVNATAVLLAKDGISYLSNTTNYTGYSSTERQVLLALDKDGAQMWSYDPHVVALTPVPSIAVV